MRLETDFCSTRENAFAKDCKYYSFATLSEFLTNLFSSLPGDAVKSVLEKKASSNNSKRDYATSLLETILEGLQAIFNVLIQREPMNVD